MRFFLRSAVLWAMLLIEAGALASMPTGISLSVHGSFDPGTSGATASNSSTISTLTLRTATITFSSADLSVVLLPGNLLSVNLGSISTAATDLNSVAFDGASLDLDVQLLDPSASPSAAVIPLTITGSVGPYGDTLTLTASTALNSVEFSATDCIPKMITVANTAPTVALSGAGPEDIAGSLSVVYAQSFVPGDVDGDGSVTLIDAVRGLLLVSGIDEAQCDEVERGDLAGTGAMDIVNVVLIARKSYGL
ncbi:MAG TPA: hypothetical protein VGM51_19525 [Armatimonadota bacterium]|jgi:hypothetical protein